MLSLSDAIKEGRIAEFINQEEARGLSDGDRASFERVIKAAVKPPQSADRTSRSPSDDGSNGT